MLKELLNSNNIRKLITQCHVTVNWIFWTVGQTKQDVLRNHLELIWKIRVRQINTKNYSWLPLRVSDRQTF